MQANSIEKEADDFCTIMKEISSEPNEETRVTLERALFDKMKTEHMLEIGSYILQNEKYQCKILSCSFVKRHCAPDEEFRPE